MTLETFLKDCYSHVSVSAIVTLHFVNHFTDYSESEQTYLTVTVYFHSIKNAARCKTIPSVHVAKLEVMCHIVMICDVSAKCIDQYVKLRVANADGSDEPVPMDPRLEGVVEKMFDRCITDRQYKQVLHGGGLCVG